MQKKYLSITYLIEISNISLSLAHNVFKYLQIFFIDREKEFLQSIVLYSILIS